MVGVEPGCKENAGEGVCHALDRLTNMDRQAHPKAMED